MFLRYRLFWRNIFFLLDSLVLNCGILLSFFLNDFTFNPSFWKEEGTHILMFNLIWYLLVYWRDFYSTDFKFIQITRDAVEIIFLHLFLVMFYLFIRDQQDFSRSVVSWFYGLFFFSILATRYLFIFLYNNFGFLEKDKRNVAILGKTGFSEGLISYLKRPDSGYNFIGYLDDFVPKMQEALNDKMVYEYIHFAKENGIQEIYYTLLPLSNNSLQLLISEAEKNLIRLRLVPDFNLYFFKNVYLTIENDIPIISFRNEPLIALRNRIIKRLFDILFSLLVTLLLLSWLIPIIGIIIKINSKGPIFFKQERWGIDNKKIVCYKFRSMVATSKDVDKSTGKYKQATSNDPRITSVGRILRKTSLDELPQFFNVILGDMSVVGPRPHPIPLNLESKDIIDDYMLRHAVKPGITGWAQVNGYRGETKDIDLMQKRVNYDIWYIENWSFLLDLKIIFKTVINAVKGEENAY